MATTASRVSMNVVIHRAFRRDLERFRVALEVFPDGDSARATMLQRAWTHFESQLHEHHEGEHETVFPALAALGIAGSTLETFDTEHEAMATDLASAAAAMQRLSGSAGRADADAAAAAVRQLQVTTLTHLDHEEQETEGPLAEQHDSPVVRQLGKAMRSRMSLAEAGTFLAWLQDGATAQERAALRQGIPGPVVTVLGGLFGRGYRRDVAPTWAGR
ncbi:MAG TPA: hemerythrin domain-containing protein [Mycobacteriales bacterium]|jgi:hypothetical protein|nr:hemerythrin domain-containing protein [Mycobacteriales bacterium]